jgi:hypothetical protein
MPIPDIPGILTADEVAESASIIAALQLPSGMIPWFPGGHCDPWNHVETAMALSVAGRWHQAELAYEWLAGTQHEDGSWYNYYRSDGSVQDRKLDTNVIAYVATGVFHHWQTTGDRGFAQRMWPTVARAIDFVLDLQTPRGEIIWARHTNGRPWSYALLTGSSSICLSLRCAVALAQVVGDDRPEWELAAVTLADVIRTQPNSFEPKNRWAMDWYYPVLTNIITGGTAEGRLAAKWDEFVMPGKGVRCVNNEPWVTAAETAECAIAHASAGLHDTATDLLRWTRAHRLPEGTYLTGLVYPDAISFPDAEWSAYTAAAVILAADIISGATPASGLFRGDHLPPVEAINEPTPW